ncbi:MAG: lipase family protein [bacterium]|nr:lipase family protein [bacterium]
MKAQKQSNKSRKVLKIILTIILIVETLGVVGLSIYLYLQNNQLGKTSDFAITRPKKELPTTGKILTSEKPVSYNRDETLALIKQTDKNFDLPVKYSITKQIIRYNTADRLSSDVPVYARVYAPEGVNSKTPILAFAPGTTGIADKCAASLEVPQKSNWANYDSLLSAYASQGFTVITTDYEGMRDPTRMHHYMVGEMEGRAVLDSIRALHNLNETKKNVDKNRVFIGGYSQGGHAAFWADKITSSYASELKIKGIIGFGPVDDVEKTWADITNGANINWFGPFVLTSYQDYYKVNYPLDRILLPRWQSSLTTDVNNHCIDSAVTYWGRNPQSIYTKEFLDALKNKNLLYANYPQLAADLDKNITGNIQTSSYKLINQGAVDNLILPDQQNQMVDRLCKNGNKYVTYKLYNDANHYNTMVKSFKDVLSWIDQATSNKFIQTSCK